MGIKKVYASDSNDTIFAKYVLEIIWCGFDSVFVLIAEFARKFFFQERESLMFYISISLSFSYLSFPNIKQYWMVRCRIYNCNIFAWCFWPLRLSDLGDMFVL